MRTLFTRLALSAGVLVLFLGALECGARVVEAIDPPPPPALPSRAPAALPPKPPGGYRIFLYGGSTTWGAPLHELSFAARLEFWLRRVGPERELEVFNFGVGGASSSLVLATLKRTVRAEPDLIIVLTAHNEFLSRHVESWLDDAMQRFATTRVLVRLRNNLLYYRFEPDLVPFERDSTFRRKADLFVSNLGSIAEIAGRQQIPLILATGASNLSEWPPIHREIHNAAYEREVAQLREQIDAGAYREARSRIQDLSDRYSKDAMLTFLLGRVNIGEGDFAEARALFTLARDRDPYPWRALSQFNQEIRAREEDKGVYLADIEQVFERHARNGLVGFELVADNCHPTPLGSALLTQELLRVMAQEGFFLTSAAAIPTLEEQLRVFQRESIGDNVTDLEVKYLLKNATYVMKTPFSNYRIADRYLKQARALRDDDWRIWANLATVSALTGDLPNARRELARAVDLHGAALDLDDRVNTPYLREALERLHADDGNP